MSDPLAAAFSRTPVPEPRPDFERCVVAYVVAGDAGRISRVRRLFRAYWISTGAISVAALAATDLSAVVTVTGAASLAGIAAGAVLAAGGIRSITRVLRTTVS